MKARKAARIHFPDATDAPKPFTRTTKGFSTCIYKEFRLPVRNVRNVIRSWTSQHPSEASEPVLLTNTAAFLLLR
jgi:hypothetical protein